MHPRTRELQDHLAASHRALREAICAVPADRREWRPADGRWSVADVLTHLARTEGQIAAFLDRALRAAQAQGPLPAATDGEPVLPTLDAALLLDRTRRLVAPEFAAPDPALDATAALARLEHARERTLAVLRAGDGLDTSGLRRDHPFLGELSFVQWLAFAGFHEQRHAAQIRELGAAATNR